MQSYSKQKYFLLGYDTPLLPFYFYFSHLSSMVSQLFFSITTVLSHNLFAHSLQSPSHFHSCLTPPPLANPLHPPLLANAATLQHNWSMPKLRQA